MRKAATDSAMPAKEASGRRYWVRAAAGAVKAGAAGAAEADGKRPLKTRFLEPYHLSVEHRQVLLDGLARAQVGDPESRDLFASAIEYDIANARQAALHDEPPPAPATQPEVIEPAAAQSPVPEQSPQQDPQQAGLGDLAARARSLAEQIGALEEGARTALGAKLRSADLFQRGYDGAYLEALCTELRRIAGAAAAFVPAAAPAAVLPPAPPPPAPLSAAARRFLRRVARVYEEVLESKASLLPGGPFFEALRLIAEEAGIRLGEDPDAVAAVLEER